MDVNNRGPMSRENLGKIGQDPSVSKSSCLHVDFVQFFFIKLRYSPHISLK